MEQVCCHGLCMNLRPQKKAQGTQPRLCLYILQPNLPNIRLLSLTELYWHIGSLAFVGYLKRMELNFYPLFDYNMSTSGSESTSSTGIVNNGSS